MNLLPDIPGTHPGGDLGAYVDLLKRRRLVFLFCLFTSFTASAALLWLTPPSYTATAEVLVVPTGVRDETTPLTARQREPLNLDTQARIAQSTAVADLAATMTGSAANAEIEITVLPNSSVLSISATAASPRAAALHAQARARAYLAYRAQQAQSTLDDHIKTLSTTMRQVHANLNRTLAELPTLPKGSAEHMRALQQRQVLNRQLHNLTVKHDTLKTVVVGSGSVISPATPPSEPSAPSLPLYLGSGVMLGLLIGAAGALIRDRLDTRLRTVRDVERLTKIQVLAELAIDRKGTILDTGPHRKGMPSPGAMHDLAAALLASGTGDHMLIRPVGTPCDVAELAATLRPVLSPVTVLTGSDLRDLARAQSALLVIAPQTSAAEVTAATRALIRHGTRVVGAVLLRSGRSPRPRVRHPEPVVDTSLGLLVAPASARSRHVGSRDTTPLHLVRRNRMAREG